MDQREEARAAPVSEECLPRVARAGPAGNGDLRAAAGKARPDSESGVLWENLRLPDGLRGGTTMTACGRRFRSPLFLHDGP